LPNLSLPNLSLPNLSLPNLSLPNLSLPNLSLPNLSSPNLSLPNLTIIIKNTYLNWNAEKWLNSIPVVVDVRGAILHRMDLGKIIICQEQMLSNLKFKSSL
jgi:hypothetical protein